MNLSDEWAPGRWWRVTYFYEGATKLWCETSNEDEARDHAKRVPFGVENVRIERLWERHATEWRPA